MSDKDKLMSQNVPATTPKETKELARNLRTAMEERVRANEQGQRDIARRLRESTQEQRLRPR